jgi:hypothetical protein
MNDRDLLNWERPRASSGEWKSWPGGHVIFHVFVITITESRNSLSRKVEIVEVESREHRHSTVCLHYTSNSSNYAYVIRVGRVHTFVLNPPRHSVLSNVIIFLSVIPRNYWLHVLTCLGFLGVLEVRFDLIVSAIAEAATRLNLSSCSCFYMKMTPMITNPSMRP